MNSKDHLVEGNIIKACDLLFKNAAVVDKPDHFGLRTAVTQLQVIKHCVILLREALIRALNSGNVRTHLVRVVRHIRNSKIGKFRRLLRVAAQAGYKRGGKARYGFHVVVCRKPRRPEGVVGVCKRRFLRGNQFVIFAARFVNAFPDALCVFLQRLAARSE